MIVSETDFDNASIRDDEPVYRVNLWSPTDDGNWSHEAYLLSEASSVLEVIAWAEAHRGPRKRVEVLVEVDSDASAGFAEPRTQDLIQLLGSHPDTDEGASEQHWLWTMVPDEDAPGSPSTD